MEYEIEEERELLDESTNPSLDSSLGHSTQQAIENQSSVKPEDYPRKDRAMQKAVLIPGESTKA